MDDVNEIFQVGLYEGTFEEYDYDDGFSVHRRRVVDIRDEDGCITSLRSVADADALIAIIQQARSRLAGIGTPTKGTGTPAKVLYISQFSRGKGRGQYEESIPRMPEAPSAPQEIPTEVLHSGSPQVGT